MALFKFFLIFVKIGAILLGGGYVILPIMNSEFVDKRKMLTSDEMLDFYALAQSLPGIVAANISMFIGYKFYGKIGAFVSIIGIVLVPFWIIIILASVLGLAANNSYIQSAFHGVEIAVIALILLTIREVWQKTNKNIFFYFIFCSALLSMLYFKLSPIQVIILFGFIGVLYKKLEAKV